MRAPPTENAIACNANRYSAHEVHPGCRGQLIGYSSPGKLGGEGMIRLSVIAVVAMLFATAAAAETVDVHAGRLVDPASAKVLSDQRIRIVDGKIASVMPWRDADGAAQVDWSAFTVLPGLIDLHTHIADGATESSDPAEPLKKTEAA